MNLDNLHLVQKDNINLAYYCPTFSLITVNKLTFQALKSLKSGESIDDVVAKNDLKTDQIHLMLQSIERSLPRMKNEDIVICEKKKHLIVNRITIHVSNDCNLRCKYCYAEGGNYGQQREIMSLHTATEFVDFCIENFEDVKQIVFFGGEPMLNIEIMDFLCNTFKQYYKDAKSTFLPKFGIITNGTILNSKIVTFIKENLSFVTVSIDGLGEFNDANRVFANGAGSYKRIAKFIHTIVQETNVPIHYEATFTQYHIDKHCTPADITKTLSNEFGISGVVIDEMSCEAKNLKGYWETLNYDNLISSNFSDLPQGFWSILNAILKRKSRQMCPITKYIFAVSVDGELYPCHMNNGERQNSLGNINSKNIFNDPLFLHSHASKFTLKDNEKCIKCWANNLCGGCSIKWFYDERNKLFKEFPNNELCCSVQTHLENILIMIVHIRKMPEIWKVLLEKVKNMSNEDIS